MNILEPQISYRNDLWKVMSLTRHIPQMVKPPVGATQGTFSGSLAFFLSFVAWLDWFVICKRKELGHGAVDNPIYRFAIYYKFLWLLGPLSHRFVDCLLSWVLMSCCLNHCIIAALIHFLAYPYTRSVSLPLLQQKGLEYLSERTIRNIFPEKRGVIVCILLYEKWQHFPS